MTWTVRRRLISAFVVVHLSATVLWNLPASAFRDRCTAWAGFYMLPLGLWQDWGMFAPNPVRDTLALEAVALDRRGLLHTFSFIHAAESSPWEGPWLYRHSKFATSLADESCKAQREYTARHVARSLDVPANDYPLDVQLLFQVSPILKPGEPSKAPGPLVIETYRFPTLEEAQP
ncbi:MAG: hypothetical protein ABI353_20030 [Isosphaeraceae bacterium]